MVPARAVRVVTEVAALDRAFDYAVTEATAMVRAGDRVRVDLHHRSVRGWVTGDAPASEGLKPLTRWLGYGPPGEMLDLLGWARERWCAPLSRFLLAASPPRLVTTLPDAPAAAPLGPEAAASAWDLAPGVVSLAPTTDPLALILGAYEACRGRTGSLLVLVPTDAWARRVRERLERRGLATSAGVGEWDRLRAGWPVVVGARGAAFAPTPRVCGAVIVDADDEAFRSEAAPTWDAFTVLAERCRREGAPLWATSMMPSPTLRAWGEPVGAGEGASGWPRVEVADRRERDPRDGALLRATLDAAHHALAGEEPVAVAVVLQRLGDGRLLACRRCGELARCAVCERPEREVDGQISCAQGHDPRPAFCRTCGATALRRARVGVSTLAREVSAQLGQPVSEVSSAAADGPLERVVVGTEAVLSRVRRCGLVVFADFDQYLLAPRESARRRAVGAVGRAGRLTGSRRAGRGAVVVQTRRAQDPVVAALVAGDVDGLSREDAETARLLGLPPYGGLAEVSGPGAREFVAALDPERVRVTRDGESFSVRAPDTATLTGVLLACERPGERVRVEVW